MHVIVSECVRYFERPLCFHMPPDHVHGWRCWDQEFQELREQLGNAESDVRALERANKLLEQENIKLKNRISPSTTGGVRGPRHSWVSFDEAAQLRDVGDVDKDVLEKMLAAYPTKPTNVESDGRIQMRRVARPDGTEGFQTADGKIFANKSQAARHAVLLQKRP